MALSLVACSGEGIDGATEAATPVTLPSGDACRDEGGGGEPQTFDAAVTVLGDGISRGRSATVTVCMVPPARGLRAVVSLTATGGATLDRSTVTWPHIVEGIRQIGAVQVTVPPSELTTVTAAIQLYDAAGEEAGRYLNDVTLLGGPDAVFSSNEPGQRRLRELALLREVRAGRLSEDEYRRELDRLNEPGPDATLSRAH